MTKELKVPKISEDVDEATVSKVLVSEGDTIKKDQAILEVESDKASVEIPADFAGKITEVKVSKGDQVAVGDVVMKIETDKEESDSEDSDSEQKESKEKSEDTAEKKDEQSERQKKEETEKTTDTQDNSSQEEKSDSADETEESQDTDMNESDQEIPVAPLARKLAREMGLDLNNIPKSGKRLRRKDITKYVKKQLKKDQSAGKMDTLSLPDFSEWGETERKALSGIRKATAKNTTQSWQHIPHVTHHDKAKVSQLETFIGIQQEKSEQKITITAIILKVIGEALLEFPEFNASLDMEKQEIIYKKYVNVGVAVDTEDGLLLPVIQSVNNKSITDLAKELSEMATKAREGKLSAEQMKGGNFTLSNLGGIGGTAFTPVIFPPQVAILGVSRTETVAKYRDGEFKPERILPLSLSYDHRLIDGAHAAKFLRWICDSLEQPMNLMLH